VATVTAADAVTVPAGPPAVSVYVVFSEGVTADDPDAETVPTPWSIIM
jgi:hypothetical protein